MDAQPIKGSASLTEADLDLRRRTVADGQGEMLALAHLRDWAHDSTACPVCDLLVKRQAFGYGLGYAAGIDSVASGS